jgi:hypothetical protein
MKRVSLSGSCLCGAVRYEVETKLKRFYFCHCAECRKLTGSAFAANILARPAEVDWIGGKDEVKRFDFPGDKSYTKVFCAQCGSSLPFLNEKGDTLYIPAGSLDSDPGIGPDVNIFWDDRAQWFEEGVVAPTCSGFPD